ncbi:MAG: SgcJ/EcaC family oxidoreductase [Betaproteobacteria bacterium]|nr:SgcJ/EcaC family oxidoreductase [Betaproteobacteria bacterium]
MQDEEQAIRQLVGKWRIAAAAGNTEHVLSLVADDAVFLAPGQAPMRKSDFAAAQAALKQFDLRIDCQIQEIRVLGDWAYCWNKLSVVITPNHGGAAVKRAGHVLSVLHKRDGAWAIVRDANMLAVVR